MLYSITIYRLTLSSCQPDSNLVSFIHVMGNTICVNGCLYGKARVEVYGHGFWHIKNGDLESDNNNGLIEIRAHKMEGLK